MLGKRTSLIPQLTKEEEEKAEKKRLQELKKYDYEGHQFNPDPSTSLRSLMQKINPERDIDTVGKKEIKDYVIIALSKYGKQFKTNPVDDQFFVYIDKLDDKKPGTFKKHVDKILSKEKESISNSTTKEEAVKIVERAVEEVEQAIKKKRKPAYNRKDRPMAMMTKAVVQREIRPHEHHKGKWEKYELIQFYKTHGYVPPLKNGNPRKFDIEKELAKLEKAEEKSKASTKIHSRIKFPGPWRRHIGRWTNEEMLEYYKEWGIIPPTSTGKERELTIEELMDKIKGIKRPKTYGLMSTKEVSGARPVKEKKKKHKEPEHKEPERPIYEEPKRDTTISMYTDLRKIRDKLSKLYDDLRDVMTESERMKYTRLHKEQKFDELLDFMEDIEKKSKYIF